MRRRRWIALVVVVAATGLVGCRGTNSRNSLASNEPALDPALGGDPGTMIVQTAPKSEMTWVDRHPMFSKPRDYYQKSGNNVVTKSAAATFVGVPAGVMGEMKQIVVGRPANPAPY